ncbi:MAG: hypothetical protein HY826_00925 [Actinobacteria bacterium]|nr:hypothetical protein [Actinomycetota bacterium]
MSYQPPPTPAGGPPRSTPIPGASTPLVGDGLAPTPGAFLRTQDMGTPGLEPPPPVRKVKKDRNWGFWLVALFIIIPTGLGIAAAVWGVLAAKDAVDKANDVTDTIQFNPLGDGDDSGVSLLVDGGPAATVAALDAAILGDPTNFVEIILYPGYAFATAQDPIKLDHLDRYQWQSGAVGAPVPQTNDPDATSKVFTIAAVNWDAIAALAAEAPRVAAVEEGEVTHIIVNRDVFTDVHDVVVRIYVSGPRGNAFIEATADGTFIRTL